MDHPAPQTAARQWNQQPLQTWNDSSLEKPGERFPQLTNRMKTPVDVEKFRHLSNEENDDLDAQGILRAESAPKIFGLIDQKTLTCPSWQENSHPPAKNISGLLSRHSNLLAGMRGTNDAASQIRKKYFRYQSE